MRGQTRVLLLPWILYCCLYNLFETIKLVGYNSTRKNILCPTVGVLSFWCPESFKCAFIQWQAEGRIFEEAIVFETWPFQKGNSRLRGISPIQMCLKLSKKVSTH